VGVEEGLAKVLQGYAIIGFDTMIFIYQFEDHPAFGPLTNTLFEALENDELVAQLSVLLAGEVLVGPKRAGNRQMLLHYRRVFSSYPNLTLHPVTMPVMERMSDLRAKYSLRTPDAIHVATGLLHGAQAFVTNDKRLRSLEAEGLDVLVVSDFVEGHSSEEEGTG
jgi:predicted nucleic acid-binding protein